MAEKVRLTQNITVEFVRTTVRPVNVRGRTYFRVEKFVPGEWANEEVVILKRRDFETFVAALSNALNLLFKVVVDEEEKRRFIREVTRIRM